MTPDVRPFVAGNWKMNGLSGSLVEIEAMRRAADAGEAGAAELVVCPPATLIAQAAWKIRGGKLGLGAQDCHTEASGAFTGDISAPMLKDAGAAYVIVGHSERRTLHHETDALVRAKAEAALKAGLTAIVCVGETRAERESRRCHRGRDPATARVRSRLAARPRRSSSPTNRSGRSARASRRQPCDVAEMHRAIRALLDEIYGDAGARIRILYGGSVKPANARELLGTRQCRRRARRRGESQGDRFSRHRRGLSLIANPGSHAMDAPLAP